MAGIEDVAPARKAKASVTDVIKIEGPAFLKALSNLIYRESLKDC